MAYDEELADRIRAELQDEDGLTEKRMFGGLAFLIHGNMAVSASGKGGLLLRCAPDRTDDLITGPAVARAVMQGREMDGWLRIDPDGVDTDDDLRRWVAVGAGYARTLPPK